jgi:gamma-glutamyltranspeptidase/glutathione hydrolase
MQLALEEHGSGMTLERSCVAPAIALAEDGITVTLDLADSSQGAARRMLGDPATAAIFYKTAGSLICPAKP